MARCVDAMGYGGQRFAEKVLGWCRNTIRKGLKEIQSGFNCIDNLSKRGRNKAEERLPYLVVEIHSIVAPTSQTDPTFRTLKLYTPLTGKSVRKILIEEFGYTNGELPSEKTIRRIMNDMGFHPQTVKKSKPLKKLDITDALFDETHAVNAEADTTAGVLRISLDTKASVHIGDFSLGGKNRHHAAALDHDFAPQEILTPFGIFVPSTKDTYLSFIESKATADCMVDCLEHYWNALVRRHGPIHTLVINADNGPECNGRRTRWLERLAQFAQSRKIVIKLAYYPPYHSKYNPIERVWGILENHWRGDMLTSVEKVLGMARSMTYGGVRPRSVRLVKKIYKTGVRLVEMTKEKIEKRLVRKKGLESYSITVHPEPNG